MTVDKTKEIEVLVRNRNTQKAKIKIRSYLREHNTLDAQLKACEWFRRLSLYPEALQLVLRSTPIDQNIQNYAADKKKQLWTARLLNLMGASKYSLQYLNGLNVSSKIDSQLIAEVFLSNYEYKESLELYKNLLPKKIGSSRENLILLLAYTDSLAGLEKYEEAIQKLKEHLNSVQ